MGQWIFRIRFYIRLSGLDWLIIGLDIIKPSSNDFLIKFIKYF